LLNFVKIQIKSNLFAINKVHNKQFIKITYHLAGQTHSFALMSNSVESDPVTADTFEGSRSEGQGHFFFVY